MTLEHRSEKLVAATAALATIVAAVAGSPLVMAGVTAADLGILTAQLQRQRSMIRKLTPSEQAQLRAAHIKDLRMKGWPEWKIRLSLKLGGLE